MKNAMNFRPVGLMLLSILSHSFVGICTERDGKRCSKGHKW